MVGTRDTPPDIENAPDYSRGKQSTVPNMQAAMDPETQEGELTTTQAQKLGRECYESSTNWINSSRRMKWNDSLRAFQGIHAMGSKYLSTDYRYRSRLFRPKTRTMVRKAEAATAAAFFSNEDVVSISAQDDNNKEQQASAEIMQRLLQHHLTKTIPWFLTLVGARQDAEVMGICVAKSYWKYAERFSHTEKRPTSNAAGPTQMEPEGGEGVAPPSAEGQFEEIDIYEKAEDHPWVDLLAVENFRFDPGADWRNPVATSPYLIEMIPMYVADVRAKIEEGEWIPVSDSALLSATDIDDDVTRRAREQGRVPGKDQDSWKPRDFDICWVRENVVRFKGRDWHFFSLSGAGQLLSNPRPLEEVYLQGIRPYVVGFVMPEAHKTFPTSKVELVKDLQTQTNDVANLRLDNVKLSLNPRQILRTGSGIDPQDARTFMPGKVLFTKVPKEDAIWDRPPDTTASSYQEQDRINLDFDDLTGDFSNSSIQGNRQVYEAVGNMEMMQGNATQIGEYEQRVFAETFVEPIIRHLVKLVQAYETDPVVLAIAGQEAKLFQKFNISEVTDFLLRQELTTRVNVGIGATNPQKRLQNFLTASQALGSIFGPVAAMGANFPEVSKEIFSLCGYKDGDRFFLPNFNPQEAMQKMQQGKDGKGAGDPGKVQAAQIQAQSKVQEAQIRAKSDERSDHMAYQTQQLEEQGETLRAFLQLQGGMAKAGQQQAMGQGMPQGGQPAGGKPKGGGAQQMPTAMLNYGKDGKRVMANMQGGHA